MKLITHRYFNSIFFLFTTLTLLFLNLYPLIILNNKKHQDRTYGLIHNNVQDFYFYQSIMNEGANGSWIIYDPFTTEPSKPSIIFSYFTWAGKLSRIFNMTHAYTYHALRIFSSILFFVAAYRLLFLLQIPFPHLAYLFFLFASPYFKENTTFMYWWTGMDPVRRAAYLPHHMLGGALLITSVILILNFFTSKKPKYILYSLPLSVLMAFIHTPSLIILLIFLPFTTLIHFLTTRKLNNAYYYFAFFWIISLIFLAVMVSQTNRGFPWNQYLLWERNLQYPLSNEIVGALGFLLPFAIIGLIISFLSKKFNEILIAAWFLFPLLLIPFASKLGMSNIRLIQGVPFLTLSILAVVGIDFILKSLKKIKYLPGLLLGVICLLFFVFSFPIISWSIKDQIREFSPVYGNTYLDNRLKNAFNFINNNYPHKTKTLATFYAGNYLPAYTHTISFIGHSGYTNNVERKEPLVNKFFWNAMTIEEALNFIKTNNITLVFQGPEEKSLIKNKLYPEILNPVYDKEEATVYELK